MKLIIRCVITLFLLQVIVSGQQAQDAQREKWQQIHYSLKTLDTHCDLPMKMSWYDMGEEHDSGYVDLPRMSKGGLDGVFLAVFVKQGTLSDEGRKKAFEAADKMIHLIEMQSAKMNGICEIAKKPEDFFRITENGKIALYMGMENGYPLGLDLNNLDYFFKRGIRYVTLCHFEDNDICDSSTDDRHPEDRGLSEFGIRAVKRMNELGMIIDVSHISRKSFFDVLQHSSQPVAASHSCVFSMMDHPQNLTDEQLFALKKNRGVIQINLCPAHLRKPADVPAYNKEMEKVMGWLSSKGGYGKLNTDEKDWFTKETRSIKLKYPEAIGLVKEFVDHIDHVKDLIGIDHVGIGSDFEGGGCLGDCYTVKDIPNITAELLKRGYTVNEIEKIWGGNFLRVFKEVCKN